MFIDSSFKVMTGFPNIYNKNYILHKQIYKLERLQKIGCFIVSWEIVIDFERSKSNFKISIFAELFMQWQLNFLLYGPNRPLFLANQNNNNTDFTYKYFSFYYFFFF